MGITSMSMDELRKKINSPDEEVRREAVEALINMPFSKELLLLIKRAMADMSWRVRKSAVDITATFKDDSAISSIVQLMTELLHSEDNAGLRNSAVEGLIRLGSKAVPYLIKNITDSDHDVRKFIVDILGDIYSDKNIDTVTKDNIVNALIGAAKDTDENVRLSAVEGLGKVGSSKAVDMLVEILKTGDVALKFTALEALGGIGRSISMKEVYNACKDKLLKRAAYDLIGKVGGAEALKYLIEGLKDNSTSTRDAAIVALKRLAASILLQRQQLEPYLAQFSSSNIEKIALSFKSNDINVKKGVIFALKLSGRKEAVLPLIEALAFDDTAYDAQEALIELGAVSVDTIITTYKNQEDRVKAILCFVLGAIGNKLVPESSNRGKAENLLISALKYDYGHVRANATIALARINPERALSEVIKLLHDEFDDVKNAAVDAICLIARDTAQDVLPSILPLLSAPDHSEREKAIIILGRVGAIEEIEKVRLALKDVSPIVRKAGIRAIEEWGEEQYAQDIILALADENREVQIAAAKALGNLKSDRAIEPLLPLLSDEDIWVRATTVESLGKIGKGSVLPVLKKIVDEDNEMLICNALEAMAKIAAREPSTIYAIKPVLAKCLSHSDTEVVKIAIEVLGRIDSEGVIEAIVPLLRHGSWDVRVQVVDILSKKTNQSARERLKEHLKIETDELIKQKITEALKDRD
ncbi:MAG TPA: hypothetical protein DCL42_08495 [Deltaproteobacteria bacterium]|nr:hypothetical protein [Deltaproteobacteria bacterium]